MTKPVSDIWIEGNQMYTNCGTCGDTIPFDITLAGTFEGRAACPSCHEDYYIYIESRGWDVQIFDENGEEYATGEYMT